MSRIQAIDVLGAFKSAMDIYLLSKRNAKEARQMALKAGYTEEELAAVRDGALESFMEPLRDPLASVGGPTTKVDPPNDSNDQSLD